MGNFFIGVSSRELLFVGATFASVALLPDQPERTIAMIVPKPRWGGSDQCLQPFDLSRQPREFRSGIDALTGEVALKQSDRVGRC